MQYVEKVHIRLTVMQPSAYSTNSGMDRGFPIGLPFDFTNIPVVKLAVVVLYVSIPVEMSTVSIISAIINNFISVVLIIESSVLEYT